MADSTTALSIIIVNWNSGALLANCLESLRASLPGTPAEVVVVDNASTDGSERIVESEFPELRLIRSGTNLGFAGANNLAGLVACGKYLLFLNPDTVVLPDALRLLLGEAGRHPDAILGPRVRLSSGAVQPDSCGHFFTVSRWLAGLVGLHRLFPTLAVNQASRFSGSGPVDWISGVCLLIRADLFRELRGFDAGMFAYLEDMDLCRRATQRGIRCWLALNVEVTHVRGGSFGHVPFEQTLVFTASRTRYVCRNWHTLWAGLFRSFYAVRYGIPEIWFGLVGRRSARLEYRKLRQIAQDKGRLGSEPEATAC
jgi:hypothetical protein